MHWNDKVNVLFDDRAGRGVWAIASNNGNLSTAFLCPVPALVLGLALREIYDCWTSSNGCTYITVFDMHDRGVVLRYDGKRFERLPGFRGGHRILGISGPSPAEDVLFCAAEGRYRHPDTGEICDMFWLQWGTERACHDEPRAWQSPTAMTRAPNGDVYFSCREVDEPSHLWRWRRGTMSEVAFPPTKIKDPRAVGIEVMPDGALLACMHDGDYKSMKPVELWRQAGESGWSRIKTPEPIVPYYGDIECRLIGGSIHLAAGNGLFVLDGDGRVRKEADFPVESIWAVGGSLVTLTNKEARVKRGASWEPYPIDVPSAKPKRVTMVRLQAPAPAEVTPPRFSFERFVEELAPSATKTVPDAVKALFDVAPAPDLAAFLARHSSPRPKLAKTELGLWNFGYTPFLEGQWSKSFTDALASSWDNLVSPLTGTVEIGRSGGSETFFAEVHPKRSTVFLLDRSTGNLHFMASSVSVFAHLNDLAEQYDAYCTARDLDGEEVDAKRIAGSPTLTALSRQMASLEGKVHVGRSDYEMVVKKLGKKRFAASGASRVGPLFEHGHWLKLVLIHRGKIPNTKLKRSSPAPAALAKLAPARVQALVSTFFFAPGDLPEKLEQGVADPAEIVRMTARALTEASRSRAHPMAKVRAALVGESSARTASSPRRRA